MTAIAKFKKLFVPWSTKDEESCRRRYSIENLEKSAAILNPTYEQELKPLFVPMTWTPWGGNPKDLFEIDHKLFSIDQAQRAMEVVEARKYCVVEIEGVSLLLLKGDEATFAITDIVEAKDKYNNNKVPSDKCITSAKGKGMMSL